MNKTLNQDLRPLFQHQELTWCNIDNSLKTKTIAEAE